jgi:hypothetical protein
MAGQLTIDTLKASSGVLATQNGMTGIAKAWVNFNGTNGTVNGSFNVSLVTYVSTGTYTVNFTTAMANANYAVSLMSSISSAASNGTTNQLLESTTPTTSAFTWNNYKVGIGVFNPLYAHVAVFGA